MPLGVGRVDDVGSLREADVVDEDVQAAEGLDGSQDDVGDAFLRGKVGLNRQDPLGATRQGAQLLDGLGEPLFAARTDGDATSFLDQRLAMASPRPLVEPVTMAILSASSRSMLRIATDSKGRTADLFTGRPAP